MADLAITAAQIAITKPEDAETFSGFVAETVTAGQPVFLDSNGKYQLADANAAGERQARGLTLAPGATNQKVTMLKRGYVFGFTLTSQSFDGPIFLSDTVGVLADAAGTVTVPVGNVASIGEDPGNITKVMYVDFRWREDYT